MSKKSFSGGLNALLEPTFETEEQKPTLSIPTEKKKEATELKSTPKKISKKAQSGTLEGETRFTCILKEEHVEKIKALAYWDRQQIKELLNEILESYFTQKGTKHINQALTAYENSKKRKCSSNTNF